MKRVLFWVLLNFVIILPIKSATIKVPSDQPTIQAGIDASVNDDTVLVADGIYSGVGNIEINLLGKRVLIGSENGADVTIIDCDGFPEAIFVLNSGEDSLTIIEGFTLTGGSGGSATAAVYCHNASPTIRNCKIINNNCRGVYAYISSAHIENCIISNNSPDGVYSFAGNPLRISDCEISNNLYSGVSLAWGGSGLEMTNCQIFDNPSFGLHIYTMVENYFISNNTFTNNRIGLEQYFVFPKSGSVATSFDSSAIINNIFAFNTERGIRLDEYFTAQSIISCNNSYGNPAGNYTFGAYDTTLFFGNISLDPQFCDALNYDFTLQSSSPCLPENNDCNLLIGALNQGCGSCCIGTRGNVDGDVLDQVDISDIVFIVDFFFTNGPVPSCMYEANIDGDIAEESDISDLVYLVDFIFTGGPAPDLCP